MATPEQLAAAKTADELNALLDQSMSASLGIVATRAFLTTFIDSLRSRESADLSIAVGTHTLAVLDSSPQASSSYLDQAATLRELIAEGHETNEDYADAAGVLAEIPLDSSQRRVSGDEKVRVWIRIVRNYLEYDETTLAEQYLNKLKNIMPDVTDQTVQLHFKLSKARIEDAKRQFLSASQMYHEISYSGAIAEEERLHTLGMAIKCAILAPAGPTRSKALGRLYKDERAAGLEEYGILEKMFLDRLLVPGEVDKFAKGLQPHQLATTADGSTVLAKAVVEHNLLGASRLYCNIDFDDLGLLLGLDGDKAEDTTARMIEQGRLVGRIDQIDRRIFFEGEAGSGVNGGVHAEMRRWDSNIRGLTEEVERVFVAADLVV